MARNAAQAAASFEALTIEGALIAPAMLVKIANHEAEAQKEADYGIPRGLTLRDEIARYFRIGQAVYADYAKAQTQSAIAAVKLTEALLRDVFGFADLTRQGQRSLNGREYAVTLEGLGGRVPIVVVPASDNLDRATNHLPGDGRRRSAASAIQDWLNASEDALWGFCCNGEKLRLVRDNASLTRPAYIEAELRQMFEGEAFADFATLWLLIHASRFGKPESPVADCVLERWREAGAKEGLAARDRLRDGVETALLALGNGFLAENPHLRERLVTGEITTADYFTQLLRLVYRLIFLMVAEERGLLHAPAATLKARKLYTDGYALAKLRERAIRRTAWDSHHDRWEGLLVTFKALAGGEPRLGLPALGGLFLSELMPDLERARLSNRALLDAIYRLAWLKHDNALVRVNWRDMETEELGSVYESLLELTPRLSDDARVFSFAEGAETKGNTRKTTGSYYTPDSLVQTLLDSALDPVLDRVEAEAENPAEALLEVTVIDPACGSGHFLLAAARRIATRVARARAGGVASAEDFRHALRDVARCCIHGVDRNPMAVELTKVALWIETVEPGKPLGFLDANIRCGDALLGVYDLEALRQGIPDAAYKPLSGDDRESARHFGKRNKSEREGQGSLDFGTGGGRLPPAAPLAAAARALRNMPEDSPDEIAEKRRHFDAALADTGRWRLRIAADLYVAAFLTPKTGGVPANANTVAIPTTAHVWDALDGLMPYGPLVGLAQDLAGEAHAFHWPLEFPDVITAGGFDVVLGNPPWERIKLQEQEFFASREPEIAEAPNAASRGRLITKLRDAEPGTRDRALYDKFEMARRTAEAASVFARVPEEERGRFPLTGRGDVNTYALFAELAATLISDRGRAGIILPTQIATADNTKFFFADITDGSRLVSFFNFFEIRQFFPATDDRNPFGLLTVGQTSKPPLFAFSLTNVSQIAEPERRFTLTPADIARINPNTKTAPVFRSRADAELTAKIYSRVPVLIDETKGKDGNPWGLSFTAMFHMANDSGIFRTAVQLAAAGYQRDGTDWVTPEGVTPRQKPLDLAGGRSSLNLDLQGGCSRGPERYVPLYEAKMIHQFDHRWATYDGTDSRDALKAEKRDPAFDSEPRYWVPSSEVEVRLGAKGWDRGWLMGWRDICRSTDERTVIATAFPRAGVGHTCPLLSVEHVPAFWAALLSNLGSLALDFVTRLKIGGTHLTYGYMKQLPLLPPSAYSETDNEYLVSRILELTYTSHSMAPFARDLGYTGAPFAWDEDRRAYLRAELDAFYAKAYGLTRNELRYILDPSDVKGPDYPSETFRVLKEKEIRKYGEYRTAKLVLQAWDHVEEELRKKAS